MKTRTSATFLGALAAAAALALAAPVSAQVIEYYHLDALGTVRAVTNANGTVTTEQHAYMPFGEELCNGVPCTAVAPGQPRRFTGKERDTETGLDYFGARYYSARVGRFTSVDPLVSEVATLRPQRWNRYAYAMNNPVGRVDPDGLDDFAVFDSFQNSDLVAGTRPDWSAIQADAQSRGHTVTIYAGSSATVQNYQAAIATSGLHVIDVSHTLERLDANGNATSASGILLSDGGVGDPSRGMPGPNGPIALTAPGTTKAASVNLFGCESASLAPQYGGAGAFTGVRSGGNGTNATTLERAGAAFLRTATAKPASQAVDLRAAANAAQRAISRSTIKTPSPQGGRATNVDRGDQVTHTP